MITQRDLQRILVDRQAHPEAEKLVTKVKTALLRHESIEAGPLTAHVQTSPRRRLTWGEVERILGPAAVARLHAELEPYPTTYLKVIDVYAELKPKPVRKPRPGPS